MLPSEWNRFKKAINELAMIKIFRHLIWNYFWKEVNLGCCYGICWS
jgi:hypothetical protein